MNSFRVNIAICFLLIVFYVEVGYSEEISCKQIGSLYEKDINSFLKLVRLKNCREHIPKLVEILEQDPASLGKQAAEILAIMGKKEKAISVYLKYMKNQGDSIDNVLLVNNLLRLGAKSAVPELIKILETKAYVDRFMISEALNELLSINDIPLLVNLLKNKDSEIRQIAIELLGQIEDKKTAKILMKYISDPDDYVKAAVIDTIVKIDIKEALSHIVKLLHSNNEDLVARSIRALGMLGVSDAAPKLLKFLRHNSELIRREAAIALARLSSKEAIPILVGYLKDNNKHFFERVDMALSLSILGYKEVVPELFNLLNNKEIPSSEYGSEGYPSEQILESFVAMCRQDDALTKKLLEVIKSSGNDNVPTQLLIDVFVELKEKRAVPIFIDLLNQGNKSNVDKTAIIEALGELKATDAVPVLHNLLKEETDLYKKRKIVISLGLIGDKEVIPFLIDLLREDTYEKATIANILMSLGEYEAVYYALENEYYKVPYFNAIRRYKLFNQEKIELLKNSNISMNKVYGFLLSSMLNGSKSDYDRQISDAIEGLKGLNPKNDTAVAILLLQSKAYGEIKKGLYSQAIDTIKKAQEYELFLSNWERKEFAFLFEENNHFLLGEAQKEMKEYDSSIQSYKNCLNILKTKEKIYENKRAIKLISYDEHRDMLIKVKKSLGYLMIENGKLFLKDAEDLENSSGIH